MLYMGELLGAHVEKYHHIYKIRQFFITYIFIYCRIRQKSIANILSSYGYCIGL
jgi:hypothetical protein